MKVLKKGDKVKISELPEEPNYELFVIEGKKFAVTRDKNEKPRMYKLKPIVRFGIGFQA